MPASAQLSATLTLTPETTLPGIPVTIRILLRNDSTSFQRVPDAVSLIATTTRAESFTLFWRARLASVPISDFFGVSSVPPHSTAALVLRATGTPLQQGWFDDARLNMPSRLQLHAVLGHSTEDGATNEIESNSVVLQIEQPEGDDENVWREMLALGAGRWQPGLLVGREGFRLSKRVVETFPLSHYAGWFATVGVSYTDTVENAAALRNWLSQAPEDEYTRWRELRLAMFEDVAGRQETEGTEKAKRFRTARAMYERLLHQNDPEIVETAKEMLKRLAQVED